MSEREQTMQCWAVPKTDFPGGLPPYLQPYLVDAEELYDKACGSAAKGTDSCLDDLKFYEFDLNKFYVLDQACDRSTLGRRVLHLTIRRAAAQPPASGAAATETQAPRLLVQVLVLILPPRLL